MCEYCNPTPDELKRLKLDAEDLAAELYEVGEELYEVGEYYKCLAQGLITPYNDTVMPIQKRRATAIIRRLVEDWL
jgi:hypothetical protein